MIPEIGHFLLWLALGVSLVMGTYPLAGAARGRTDWMALVRPCAYLLVALVTLAYLCLGASFVMNDFSVINVARNSNSSLPLPYRIAAECRPCCSARSAAPGPAPWSRRHRRRCARSRRCPAGAR